MRTLGTLSRFVAVGCLAGAIALLAGIGVRSADAQSSGSVTIADFSFSAATVTIEAGGSVTWTNSGAAPHTATGDGGTFDTGTINPGESATITFDTPGTYTYFCAIHPSMTATVVVLAVDDPGEDPGEDPVTELPTTGAGFDSGGSLTLAAGLGALAFVLLLTSTGLKRRMRQ